MTRMKQDQTSQFLAQIQKNLRKQSLCNYAIKFIKVQIQTETTQFNNSSRDIQQCAYKGTTTQPNSRICPISDLMLSDKELVEGYENISNFKLDNMNTFIKREYPNQSPLVSLKIRKQNSKATQDSFIRPKNMNFKMDVFYPLDNDNENKRSADSEDLQKYLQTNIDSDYILNVRVSEDYKCGNYERNLNQLIPSQNIQEPEKKKLVQLCLQSYLSLIKYPKFNYSSRDIQKCTYKGTTIQSYQGICPISDLILSDKELVEGYEKISNFKLDNMNMFIKREDPNQSPLVNMEIRNQNSKDTQNYFFRPTDMNFKQDRIECQQT
ncbi:hypothetical protein TTHERM_00171690 (macronuclear) [Tetrahymena thermophila SB210]|uniref:Uncharacterized protein n=1 Tax=Tetrahymena thermophila (strain SB210) TaxID=312017 RepID=Q22TF6_TETTS|nr:hypothetical protein TTHERM_00171690 [Tetrahymena thermophila SB210]EAR88482.2 hypothetical protein TTHERM_00171690 [Tetrahymena thermophila SB210]|eukprot:XP_001008727.2 hypothetical protein TTHERM_00171690 [Tetrahymena thermophila SB210]